MNAFSYLRLLLWKNYLLQIRHPWVTVFEILIPCFFAAMLASIRIVVKATPHPNVTTYESFNFNHIPEIINANIDEDISNEYVVLYAPNNSRADQVMLNVVQHLNAYHFGNQINQISFNGI
jgi:ATP-binding cassette, subfamily A (ABC1), member 3